ncbi:MAG TPA: DUF2189 domain-containing protein [Aquabacterium sp.]|nr:DUF2189 domain-containing protein [Aquabacterium sp.]
MNEPLRVRRIHSLRSLRWLAKGWSDFTSAPMIGLTHGAVIALFGGLLLWFGWTRFWALAGAFSGFLLVAPVLSTGLYAVSRALARDEAVSWSTVWRVWLSLDRRLVAFGLLLTAQGTVWVLTSAALIQVWADAPVDTPEQFVRHVILSPHAGLFEGWLLFGGLLAAPVFASTLVTIPLLMDRPQVGVVQAISTSLRAVATNPVLSSLWAAILMTLTLIGFGSMMFLLIMVLPVLGHASWHAYRDLVVRES